MTLLYNGAYKIWKGSEAERNSLTPNPSDQFYTTNSKKHYVCVDIGTWTYFAMTG